MSEQSIQNIFANHSFLADLDGRHSMILGSGASPFTAGRVNLGRTHQTAQHFYLIQSGHVSIETSKPDGQTVRVQTVGPGEAVDVGTGPKTVPRSGILRALV